MAWLRHRKLRGCEVAMALFVLLAVPLHILCLTTPAAPQHLDFWVLHTSVEKEQNRTLPKHREPRFLVNHSLQMLCKYSDDEGIDYCGQRSNTSLIVFPDDGGAEQNKTLILQNLVVLERTKCNLTIELHNVTKAFEGLYLCKDLLNPHQFRARTFFVGEAPVAPQDLRVVYEPKVSISLLWNPVKTSQDLNDDKTDWTFIYQWGRRGKQKHCTKQLVVPECQNLTPGELCQGCIISLEGQYDGSGQYHTGDGRYDIGDVTHNISFHWNITNMFGSIKDNAPFLASLQDWVKPGKVGTIEVIDNNSTTASSLGLRVQPPNNVDQWHLINMPLFPLQLKYRLDLLSARNQSLLSPASARFFEMYEFVRNLEDDEKALEEGVRQFNFSGLSELLNWTSTKIRCRQGDPLPSPLNVTISGLPFPGYYYKISMVTRARYWGDPVVVNPTAKTKDAAPLEGPALHGTYCRPSLGNPCMTCFIYIKEVAGVKRGGEVIQHTLSLNLTQPLSDNAAESCENREGVRLAIGGHNNTFLVPQLAAGAVYHVQILAFTSAGASPPTLGTLNVTSSPPDSAPTDIVLEWSESGKKYNLSWSPGKTVANVSLTYYGHYCYALPVQLQLIANTSNTGSVEAPVPLNCVTNMVMKKSSEPNASFVVFDNVEQHRLLTPVFFVSSVGPQGVQSGLQAVDCFYSADTYPKAVDIVSARPLEDDHRSLAIKFPLPCGQDLSYTGGRPVFYAIRVVPDNGRCQSQCQEMVPGQDIPMKRITGSLKCPVEHTQRSLAAGSPYCVKVNVAGQYGHLQKRNWRCLAASTGKASDSFPRWIVVVAVIVPVLFIAACVCIWWSIARYKKGMRKFGDIKKLKKQFGSSGRKTGRTLHPSSSNSTEVSDGVDNPRFSQDRLPDIPNHIYDEIADERPHPVAYGVRPEGDAGVRDIASATDYETVTDDINSDDEEYSGYVSSNQSDTESDDTAGISSRYRSDHLPPDAAVDGVVSRRESPLWFDVQLLGQIQPDSEKADMVARGSAVEVDVEDGPVSDLEREERGREEYGDFYAEGDACGETELTTIRVEQTPAAADICPVTTPQREAAVADSGNAFINHMIASAEKAASRSPLTVQALDVDKVTSSLLLSLLPSQPFVLTPCPPAAFSEDPPASQASYPSSSPAPPGLSAQAVLPQEEAGTSCALSADSSAVHSRHLSSSSINKDVVIQSMNRYCPSTFLPSPSNSVLQGVEGYGESVDKRLLQTPTHCKQDVNAGEEEEETVKQQDWPHKQNPVESPITLQTVDDSVSGESSQPESCAQVRRRDPLNIHNILREANKCLQKQPDLLPCAEWEKTLQQQQSVLNGESQSSSSQESGVSMDENFGPWAESNLKKLVHQNDGTILSEMPPSQRMWKAPSTDEESVFSSSDSSHHEYEDQNGGSPSTHPLLPFPYKPSKSPATNADSSSSVTTRL